MISAKISDLAVQYLLVVTTASFMAVFRLTHSLSTWLSEEKDHSLGLTQKKYYY